jgi:beta-lactamase superfamily II metal-dependent hydrolase
VPSRPVKIRTLLAALWIAGSCLLVVASGPIDSPAVSIVFINVGHGDAILVDYDDTEILIDAGPYDVPGEERHCEAFPQAQSVPCPSQTTSSAVDELLCQVRGYVEGQIEMAVVTHPDADHYGGFIALLDPAVCISVARWRLFFPSAAPGPDTPCLNEFEEVLGKQSDTSLVCRGWCVSEKPELVFEHDGLRLWAIATAAVPSPDPDHRDDYAPILILEYGGTALVLSGDSRTWQGVEEELRGRFQTVALLAPHHGHGEFDDFFSQMVPSPDVIIISDECVPSRPALTVPRTGCSALYSTAENGTIVLTTDGAEFDVCVQKGEVIQR